MAYVVPISAEELISLGEQFREDNDPYRKQTPQFSGIYDGRVGDISSKLDIDYFDLDDTEKSSYLMGDYDVRDRGIYKRAA